MNPKLDELRSRANQLPLLPGVYIMKDARGEVIYVGKAKALKNRVTSYFRGEHTAKTAAMVERVDHFDIIVAASEFEALVLENSLIKQHMPKYNILLKDDKGYPFIRLDVREEYPRFTVVGRAAPDGARYFGPFGGRGLTHDIIDAISKALGLPTCSRRFPADIGRGRPCLNRHMGVCHGWCQPGAEQEDYRSRVTQAVMLLEGRNAELCRRLEEQMLQASDALRFEVAAQYRDRLRAVSSLSTRQHVISAVAADTDAVGWYRGAKCCFAVLHYVDGALAGKDMELLEEPLEPDEEVLSALVRQYYENRAARPRTILLPMEPEDAEPLARMLSQAAGHAVELAVPQRGDRRRLIEAAMQNAATEAGRAADAVQKRLKTLEWLQRTLALPRLPERIEAFDISNTGDFGIVAAMTVFYCGKPLRRDYRKFRIRAGTGQDDYGSMREAVYRRFARLNEGDEKFSAMPDLLLIDGGRGQVTAALEAMGELGVSVPVFGMVKDDRHRTRALVSADGAELGLAGNPAVFALIGTIQEETHRSAITYHRSLRAATIQSQLDQIHGVGKARRNALLQEFKTIRAIRSASVDELRRVVPLNTAKAVYEYFHGEDKT